MPTLQGRLSQVNKENAFPKCILKRTWIQAISCTAIEIRDCIGRGNLLMVIKCLWIFPQQFHSLIYSVFAYVCKDVYMDVHEALFIITKDRK